MTMFRTFGKLSNPADLYEKCRSLSESLANDLRDERLVVSNPAGAGCCIPCSLSFCVRQHICYSAYM